MSGSALFKYHKCQLQSIEAIESLAALAHSRAGPHALRVVDERKFFRHAAFCVIKEFSVFADDDFVVAIGCCRVFVVGVFLFGIAVGCFARFALAESHIAVIRFLVGDNEAAERAN